MDDFQKNKDNRDIYLSEFDLTDFKEYFKEEDAQREAEEKLQAERKAREDAERIAQEERARIEEQRKIEEAKQKQEEEIAAKRSAEFELREKEEARRAAEKAAAAVLAAQKAEEARLLEQKEISERLLSQAGINNEMNFEQANNLSQPVVDKAKNIEFAEFSSILDIENNTAQQTEATQADNKEISDFAENEPKKSNAGVIIICIILALATVVCSTLAFLNFKNQKPQTSPEVETTETKDEPGKLNPFENLTVKYNDVTNPDSINENLRAMYSENNDLAGWLTIEGTSIDYPIVQDSNNKHYLSGHNVYNESARYGTPFVDFRCSKTELSKNTIIYGHRMKNGTHFGLLEQYADIEHYKKHPVISYESLSGSYSFKVYAVFYATTQGNADAGYVFDYYNPKMSDDNFEGYIKMLNQYAIYTTDAGLEKEDKIITLSTCTHVYDNLKSGGVDTRFVVVGRLLRDGESEKVNTEKVTLNSDYRRPQLWYDKNNKANPYSSHRNWKPSL